MKVSIFGSGYVGLVTGTCFAEMGNNVLCVDIDQTKVEALRKGHIPIFEPGLEEMVMSNVAKQNLHFSTDINAGVDHGDIIFIAVGTPEDEDGSADLQYVLSVANSIGQHMSTEKIIVDKSTVPVGTADQVRATVARALAQRNNDTPFHVVSNPEFLKEGAAISDFMKPDRVVIGSDNPEAAKRLEQLYAPFNRNHDKIVHMDVRSAELTKYAANVMLATRISLMNEFANLADRLGADIEAVRKGIGTDPRIGHNFIYPGTGYGGSCFPKDVKALIHTASNVGYDAQITRSVEAVNAAQKRTLFDKLMAHFDGDIVGRTFALWGLAFKPNTDDMREAPSQTLIQLLTEAGAQVRAYDAEATETAKQLFKDNSQLSICNSSTATLTDEQGCAADALLIVTEWNEFRSPDFALLKNTLKHPVIFDGRNLYDPNHLANLGFSYYSIGRPSVNGR
ncbi:MAG: UDP-glucose/GDP-mannose dehydrogenase family protein [Pseudomonadota bacterium]|nr:UDP-glucose/GDP-mannose dehydrogenase family protein [Pseudomonadota bacterium]